MIRLLLEPVNLLILDEPTNHLDMQSKDVLKEAIKAFDGTVIVVSHDREFLDGLVTKVYEFGGGKVWEHLGGIYDWLKAPLHLPPVGGVSESSMTIDERLSMSSSQAQKQTVKASPTGGGSEGAIAYLERKEQQKKVKRVEKSIKEVETKIQQLEARIKELDEILCTPEGASDMTVVTEYTSIRKLIDQHTERWEHLYEELEQLQINE